MSTYESDLHSNEHYFSTGIAEVMGSNPVQAWIFFSGLIFTTAEVVFITAKIAFILTSLSAVQIIDFHIFTVVYR